ncbi:ATP-binding cassette domain-containing protein [Fidelibacter multiformis]|uniref:ATP-binding cassette domain-containing protein n=1 Tax=Fidelibacter multiformis TaxID=3377529 RepID=UPI0037DCAB0C
MIRLSELQLYISDSISLFIPPLDLHEGTIYLLLGDSGCGKTSFLKALAGFIPDDKILGDIPAFRSSLLLQNPMHQMITTTVESELKFPLIQHGFPDDVVEHKSRDIAEYFHLESLLETKLYDLSFGELQSVMLAATLLIPADLLLLDEPTSHLDYPVIEKMYSWIRKYRQNSSCLIASQFPDEYCFADQILHFHGHRLVQAIPAKDYPLFSRENDFTSSLAAEEITAYLKAI